MIRFGKRNKQKTRHTCVFMKVSLLWLSVRFSPTKYQRRNKEVLAFELLSTFLVLVWVRLKLKHDNVTNASPPRYPTCLVLKDAFQAAFRICVWLGVFRISSNSNRRYFLLFRFFSSRKGGTRESPQQAHTHEI